MENLIPLAADFTIKLVMCKANFGVLYTSNPVEPPPAKPTFKKYKIQLENAYITLSRKRLSEAGQRQIASQIGSGLSIPYIDYRITSLSISSSQKEFQTSNITTPTHPKKMLIFMASERNVLGNPHNTPFNFKNYKLTYLRLNINGVEFQERCDFPRFLSMQTYHNMLKALGVANPRSFPISYLNWISCHTFFAFDTTLDSSVHVRVIQLPMVNRQLITLVWSLPTSCRKMCSSLFWNLTKQFYSSMVTSTAQSQHLSQDGKS